MTLRFRSLPLLAAFGLAATPLAGPMMTLAPESRLWVEGTSTVRSWNCKAPVLEATIAGDANAAKEVLDGSKGISAVTLVVPVQKMNCNDNDTMNEHMRKALKATEFPTITFKLASYELVKGTPALQATLTGSLLLGGVEKPMTFPVEVTDGGAGKLRVTGSATVKMKDHDLKPPSLMLGTMRVGNDVTVKFDLLLNP
ncbi:MAG: YceI family protein [Gemmatimonadetes bacterium]|nr:YceI family protein [Gemmatimonadota bacterium]